MYPSFLELWIMRDQYMFCRNICIYFFAKFREVYTVKKIYRIPVFYFTRFFRNGKTPMLTRDFWCPPEKEFFVFWGGKSIPLSAGVIFFLSVECYISLFPLFPFKFTGKLMEDSWLATRAPGRVAIKFGHWEKNSAPFVQLQVWKSVKILVNQSF